MKISQLQVSAIKGAAGSHALSARKVADLARSIQEFGLLQPILVRRERRSEGSVAEFTLVAGHHRFQACAEALGKTTIAAIVIDAGDGKPAVTDRTPVPDPSSPDDEARVHARRKAILDKLHPERLGDHDLARIAGTSLSTGSELNALVRLPNEHRESFIRRATNGEPVSARAETGTRLPVQLAGRRLEEVRELIKQSGQEYLRRMEAQAMGQERMFLQIAMDAFEASEGLLSPSLVSDLGMLLARDLLDRVRGNPERMAPPNQGMDHQLAC